MIENDILRDILLEEERVPSTNELAKLYAINPATAAKGVNLLVDEEILYKKRGIGMFVSTGAKRQIMEKRKKNFYDDYVKSLLAEAGSLGTVSYTHLDVYKRQVLCIQSCEFHCGDDKYDRKSRSAGPRRLRARTDEGARAGGCDVRLYQRGY